MSLDRLGDHKRAQAAELFRLARTAIRAGEKAHGKKLLLQAVEKDANHAEAWLWLSATTDDPAEQRQYLEWAIAADPGNAQARRGLALLTGQLKKEELLPEGASVAPRQPSAPEAAELRRTFDCPQCGGRLRFAPELVDLQCAHCGYVEVVEEERLTDGARPLDLTLPTVKGHRWAEAERLFTCRQCGASTVLPVGAQSTGCPFCGNAALVRAPEDVDLITPQGLLPMALDAERARRAVREWLGSGWLAPENLTQLVRGKQLRPAYVPFWIFEAALSVKWQAEVAEGYGRNRRWVWRSGERTFFFTDRLEPGLRALPADLLKRLPKFDLTKLLVFKPEYLADWPAANYDISLADASLNAREAMVKDARRELRYKAAPGQEVRNLEASTNTFTGELYRLVLLPLWIGSYQYQGRTYRVLINGQTGAVAGERPLDYGKVALLALAAVAVLLCLTVAIFLSLSR